MGGDGLLLGALLSFLPERYRRRWAILPGDAIISGGLQTLLCLGLLFTRFVTYIELQMAQANQGALLHAAERGGETLVMSSGLAYLFAYLFSPAALLLVYFAAEGVLRAAVALSADRAMSTLPLYIAAIIHNYFETGIRSHKWNWT
jgi:hypothetical protein